MTFVPITESSTRSTPGPQWGIARGSPETASARWLRSVLALCGAALVIGCGGSLGSQPRQTGSDGGGVADAPDASSGEDGGACGVASTLQCGDRLDHHTLSQGRPNQWSAYSCSQKLESGPESIYAFGKREACQVGVRLTRLSVDLDLFALSARDPFACIAGSATPLDIQRGEFVTFDVATDSCTYLAVDGYVEASGTYRIEADCLCGSTRTTYGDGNWRLAVNRAWPPSSGGVQLPTDELPESAYSPITNGTSYAVAVSSNWLNAKVGSTPYAGSLEASRDGKLHYSLGAGTFAGGRFVVWRGTDGLEAELTLYGSGVPIVSSERGTLTPEQ